METQSNTQNQPIVSEATVAEVKSVNMDADNEMVQREFEALLDDYRRTAHSMKIELITRAFEYAKQKHAGVRRKSGEPYIMHPLAVARIVVGEIGLGSTSICAALLHDVVEDTDTTVEDIAAEFGEKIASIVDGLTKISGGVFGPQASLQAENFRKLLLTMSDDVRVVLIKIADRLHNMRTLSAQKPEKQYKIAGETQYIYAPLAHRLGLFSIKTELEDLSFLYEHPDTYAEIKAKLETVKAAHYGAYDEFAAPIYDKLEMMGYKFTLDARIKSIYSIWKKMMTKNIPFEEVYDLLAMRIVFEPKADMSEKDQCWMIYSALTEIYKPHPERIRDWISTPKVNGYEALHVTVMGKDGEWVEVQIRTNRMHEIAERGLAAHWKYKTGYEDESELDKWIRSIKDLLKHPDSNAMEFLETFKLNLFASEIFVFTPQGEIRTLPMGATVLDFAYLLHSELGLHCTGAKVNRRLEPLSYVLKSGDQVEVITNDDQIPTESWLDWATTAKAKDHLKKYLRKIERQTDVKNAPKTPQPRLTQLKNWIMPKSKRLVLTDEALQNEYCLAPCCHPIPGDEVLGYMDESGTIIIHRMHCPEADKLKTNYGKNLYSAEWKTHRIHTYKDKIEIRGIDKIGMVIEILDVISAKDKINIHDLHFTARDGIFSGEVELFVHDVKELMDLCGHLRKIKEISSVRRVEI